MTKLSSLPAKKLKKVLENPEALAKAAKLTYVTDSMPGINRKGNKKKFEYYLAGKKLKSKKHLKRIHSLVIPPAWSDVWICEQENGHLQVTGLDDKQRKQYKYHSHWEQVRSLSKFYKLYSFGVALPRMRLQIEKDLAKRKLSERKVLAAVVSLMERTHIRVGNTMYEKLYGSYGLTTLKDKHVDINGSNVHFEFVGKKGVKHAIDIRSKKLSKIVKECRDVPGKELFQYYNEENKRKKVDSGMVNEYIKEIAGGDSFTAKDFRTWAGSVEALMALKEMGGSETKKETKQKMLNALDQVSDLLGNTRAVCKKYYVHPSLLSLYEQQKLQDYIAHLDKIEENDNKTDLTSEEKVLMRILKENS